MQTEEMIGVECPVCHEECFRLIEREAKLSPDTIVMIKCCPRCQRKIDYENEKIENEKLYSGMTKRERHLYRMQVSQEWAEKYHSHKVVVRYDVSNGRGGWLRKDMQVTGVAYYLTQYKWGHLKIVIDESEYSRIKFVDSYYYNGWTHVDYKQPVLDGYEWNEVFITDGWNGKEDKPYCFHITWSDITEGRLAIESIMFKDFLPESKVCQLGQ